MILCREERLNGREDPGFKGEKVLRGPRGSQGEEGDPGWPEGQESQGWELDARYERRERESGGQERGRSGVWGH